MKKLVTLLVDDEISALRTLRGMLTDFCPQVEIVAVASSVKEAVEKTKKYMPELVFLDVEMPPFGSGFEFLEKCNGHDFGVIFTTAYPKYAIEAINSVQPWAYLVKPFSVGQLRDAVAVAVEKKEKSNEVYGSLVVHDSRKGDVIVKLSDIYFFSADSGFIEVHYIKNEVLDRLVMSKSFKELMGELPTEVFCRCHHGFIVNLSIVERYERTGRNGVLYLKGGDTVPISIGKKEEFETRFETYLRER